MELLLGPARDNTVWRDLMSHIIVPMCFETADKAVWHPYIVMHLSARLKFTARTMDEAASAGNLKLVQWFHANRREGCTDNAMDWAARGNHLGVVRWLHENRREGCTAWAMDWAAARGHLDVVRWLHENRRLSANRTEGCTEGCTESCRE